MIATTLPRVPPVRLASDAAYAMLVCGTLSRVYTLLCGTSAALSSPFRLYFDVLNPKMFVKTGVFRHSFSCHFFFCVVFKELFAAAFFRLASLQLGKVRPRSSLRVPRFSSSCLVLREKSFAKTFALAFALAKNKMVGLGRLELLTSRLSGVRSNQLSYRPM